jgi:hypothetical protein
VVSTSPTEPADPARPDPWPVVAAAVALVAMVPVGVFYAASGLLVPGPWVYLLWLLYVVLLALSLLLARRRSYLVLAVPVAGAATWFAILQAGETWWGWTG